MAIDTIKAQAIFDGTVGTDDLADGSIATDKLANSAVTTAKLNNGSVTTDKITDGNVTTAKIADGEVTVGKLASTLDLSSNTVTLPDGNVTTAKLDANAVTESKMDADLVHTVKISEAEVTSSVSSYDILLDPTNYDRYILYIRDLSTSNSATLRIRKLISAGTTGDNCYGGGRWAGEGIEGGGQYSNQPGYYFLGDTTRVSMDTGAYKASWRFDIVNQTDGKQNITGHGAHRQATGQATNITSGALNINGGNNYGIRIDSSGTLTMRYTLYGVKQI